MEQEIIEGNKLIKEFMASQGDEYCIKNRGNNIDMFYHSSWNCLMPVVEKICKENEYSFKLDLGLELGKFYHRAIFSDINDKVIIWNQKWMDSALSAAHFTVVRFIKWHNQNKPQ